MVRVPLLFRGVAILLLIASTAVGQTPEPPTELLSLDPLDSSPPDFLRQFSTDSRHPLLTLMVDGELASFEASSAPDSSKLKPTPKASSSASKSAADDDCVLDGGVVDGGALDGCQIGTSCPTVSNCMPFACFPPPPACNCRKCQRQRKHGHNNCGGYGYGAGYGSGGGWNNPYLNWPTCPAWCFYGAPLVPAQQGCGRHCGRRHGCGNQNYGYPYGCGYGGGWNMMGGDGFMEGGCGCFMALPPQQCGCRRCQRHQRQHGCGNQGYGYGYGGGYGGFGGGSGMGYGGYMNSGFCGSCMPYLPPPQQNLCRRCQRKHGCSSNYGYWGYGCPGWGGHPGWEGGYCGSGCGRHHGHFRGHRCHGQQPSPYCPYPMMMPCMGGGMLGMGDGMLGMDGGMLGTGGETLGMEGGLGGDLTFASE